MSPYHNLNPHVFWPQLPTFTRLYSLVLCIGSLYIFYSLSRILIRLHSLKRLATEDPMQKRIEPACSTLRTRLNNVRQVVIFLWLVFGLTLFVELALMLVTMPDSRLFPIEIMMMGITAQSGFASLVFLVYLVLHIAQWAVSSRLASFAARNPLD